MKSSAQASGPTAIIRAYNALIRAGDLLGLTTPEVCPDRLREQAERTTGLSHWGDSPFQASLESVVRSAQEGRALTPMGRLALRKMMRRSLVNKLLLEDLARNAKEQFQVPVVRPVFIVGWYRSGTTLLHRLLAGMPGFRAPEAWELHFPVPGRTPAPVDRGLKLATTEAMLLLARQCVPNLDQVHSLRARSAEESTLFLDNELCAVYAIHALGAQEHGRWLLQQDLTHAYQSMKRQLQLLAGPTDPRRWVMKCPFSLWNLDTLLDVFPDAVVIRTHRAVTAALPSVCSLSRILQTGFREDQDPHVLGRFWTDFYVEGLRRSRLARARHPRSLFLDVDYRALTADPEGTARWLREQLDLDEAPTLSQPIVARDDRRPYRSQHRYSLEQYGLDAHELHERFGPLLAPLPGARRAPLPGSARPESHG